MVKYCPDCGSEIEETNSFSRESNNDAKLLIVLELERNRLEVHGNKIWDEIKHFSWALYILLAATPLLRISSISSNSNVIDLNLIWINSFPVFAVFVAFIALLSFWNESKNFNDAFKTILTIETELGLTYLFSPYRNKKLEQSQLKKLFCTGRGFFTWYFLVLLSIGFLEIYFLILDP